MAVSKQKMLMNYEAHPFALTQCKILMSIMICLGTQDLLMDDRRAHISMEAAEDQ